MIPSILTLRLMKLSQNERLRERLLGRKIMSNTSKHYGQDPSLRALKVPLTQKLPGHSHVTSECMTRRDRLKLVSAN